MAWRWPVWIAALVVGVIGASAALGSPSALHLQPVVRGLDEPVFVTAAPGQSGRLYVVEQAGLVRIVENGRVLPRAFLDVRARVDYGGERGLLGLAFHPRYAKNRRFFVNFTDRQGTTRVVEYRSRGLRALPATAKTVLSVPQPYGNHNGGMVAFGADGKLYVGMGDGGSGGDPEDRAQDMSTLLGKLVRIDVNAAKRPRSIAALGLRNPWRFSFDRETDDLWIGDVGQGEVEEIDFVAAGRKGLLNFGWDIYEGSRRFEDTPQGPGTLVMPIAEYTHRDGCSVTGGYVYRGRAVPAARGRYFYGDYCSGTIWSLRQAGGKAQGLRRERFRVPDLVSFGEDLGGELYLVSHGGTIFRLRG